MRYGNCLIGVLVLAIQDCFRGRIRKLRHKRHFVYFYRNGIVGHYQTVKDILPDRCYWLMYEGRFEFRRYRHM